MAKYAEKEAPLLERIIMQEGLERSKAEDWARDEITRLSEENARLRAVIQFILDNQISERRSEHIDCVIIHGEPIRAARAAIREGETK